MNFEILKQFGLHNNDILVYEALCSLGVSKTGAMIKETGIASSRVYESLRALIEKGLVTYFVKNNIKYYRAELPNKLIDEYKQNIDSLNVLSQVVSALPNVKKSRNEINVFEGAHGFELAFRQHIDAIEKGGMVAFTAFSSQSINSSSSLRKRLAFFEKVDDWTFVKTSNVRMIVEESLIPILKERKKKYLKKYKFGFLPENYFGPIAMNLSEQEVMLSVWGKKPVVFSIKNQVVVESFWKNFEHLWKASEKRSLY